MRLRSFWCSPRVFCARWQRSTDAAAQEALKKGSDQDAYDDLAIELLSALNPFEQHFLYENRAADLQWGGACSPVMSGYQKNS
uniref:Uncharacterized protein n=1 Tax=Caenorhabditis japonica TaxID=281687 RepID=A0A8R1IFT8_CAEJA